MGYVAPLGIPHSKFLAWSPEDRAKALAFKVEEATRCQMCGTAQWEWDENKFAYEPVGQRCQGCYLKDIAQEDSDNAPGVSVTLMPPANITDEMREAVFGREDD